MKAGIGVGLEYGPGEKAFELPNLHLLIKWQNGSKLASCPSVNGQVVIDLLSPELVKGGGTWVVPREFSSRPKMDEGFLCFLLFARRNE